MISITVTDDTGDLIQRMVIATNTVADWTPFFRSWRVLWLDSRKEMFSTSGASIGAPWPMYSKATSEAQYAAIKGKLFGRRMRRQDLLRWLGGRERLYPSLTEEGHTDTLYEETGKTSASYGTRVPYAGNHDKGVGVGPAWAGSHRIPKRPLMLFGHQLEQATSTLAGAFAAAGLHSFDESGSARAGLSTAQVRELMNEYR